MFDYLRICGLLTEEPFSSASANNCINTFLETDKLNKESDFTSQRKLQFFREMSVTPKDSTEKVACMFRTMVKLFLRIHLGCSEECQILINSTTQQLKAFRESGKMFLQTSFLPFPSHLSLPSLLAQKVLSISILSLTQMHQ